MIPFADLKLLTKMEGVPTFPTSIAPFLTLISSGRTSKNNINDLLLAALIFATVSDPPSLSPVDSFEVVSSTGGSLFFFSLLLSFWSLPLASFNLVMISSYAAVLL